MKTPLYDVRSFYRTVFFWLAFLSFFFCYNCALGSENNYLTCVCGKTPCACFIQLNDGGKAINKIVSKFIEQGYLNKGYKSSVITEKIKQAIIRFQADHGLEATAVMDDATLTILLNNGEDDSSLRIGNYAYIPTDGGEKYHFDSSCSDMAFPRIVSIENAKELGFSNCKICARNAMLGLTFSNEPSSFSHNQRTREVFSNNNNSTAYSTDALVLEPDYEDLDALDITKANSSDSECQYVASKKSTVFHKTTCSSAKTIDSKNRVLFHSRNEALQQGYRPCYRCDP